MQGLRWEFGGEGKVSKPVLAFSSQIHWYLAQTCMIVDVVIVCTTREHTYPEHLEEGHRGFLISFILLILLKASLSQRYISWCIGWWACGCRRSPQWIPDCCLPQTAPSLCWSGYGWFPSTPWDDRCGLPYVWLT